MKPQIQERRSRPVRTAGNFNPADALLVLAIADLPAGYDFEAIFRYARNKDTAVLVLQAIPFEITDPTGIHIFSLGLSASDHEAIAAIHLAANVADIRAFAAMRLAG